MEESDSILLLSLKTNNCLLNESLTALENISSAELVSAAVRSLHLIDPKFQSLSETLPAETSLRFRVGQKLASDLQSLGYREKIGYDVFLYPKIHDTRRILRFLVDLLPKEEVGSKLSVSKSESVRDACVSSIRSAVRMPWLLTAARKCRKVPFSSLRGTSLFHDCISRNAAYGKFRYGMDGSVDDSGSDRLPTLDQLLARASETAVLKEVDGAKKSRTKSESGSAAVSSNRDATQAPVSHEERKRLETEQLEDSVQNMQELLEQLSAESAQLSANATALQAQKTEETKNQEVLREIHRNHKKICKLLEDKQGNSMLLRTEMKEIAQEIMAMATEWEVRRQEFVSMYEDMSKKLLDKSAKSRDYESDTARLRLESRSMASEIKEKEERAAALSVEWERMPKDVDRSSYVRSIMDIVRNVKKQQKEIDKVLSDIQALQKDINNVSEALRRSFAVTEDLVFKEAQKEESVKNPSSAPKDAYRLLIKLKESFEALILSIEQTGQLKNSNRTLELRIAYLYARNDGLNAQRVMHDLEQVRNENSALQTGMSS
eukprot:ANDGO_02829.mRNA.1 hypothetical protein